MHLHFTLSPHLITKDLNDPANVQLLLMGIHSTLLEESTLRVPLMENFKEKQRLAIQTVLAKSEFSTTDVAALVDVVEGLGVFLENTKSSNLLTKTITSLGELQVGFSDWEKSGTSDEDRFTADEPGFDKLKTIQSYAKTAEENLDAAAHFPEGWNLEHIRTIFASLKAVVSQKKSSACSLALEKLLSLETRLQWWNKVGGCGEPGKTWLDSFDGNMGDFSEIAAYAEEVSFIEACNPTDLNNCINAYSKAFKAVRDLHEGFEILFDSAELEKRVRSEKRANVTLFEGLCLREISNVVNGQKSNESKQYLTTLKRKISDTNVAWTADFPTAIKSEVESLTSLKKRKTKHGI